MVSYEDRKSHDQVRIKFIRGATSAPLVPVSSTSGGSDAWRQVDFLNPADTNLMVVAGVSEHPTGNINEHQFWYHEVALVLDGEMLAQDMDTGAVYRAREGDLFYWAPGLRLRFGGAFRLYFVKTPVPIRWTKTPRGKKRTELLHLKGEYVYPGTPPDELRREKISQKDHPVQPKIKFIRGALQTNSLMVTEMPASGVVQESADFEGSIVNPIDSNLVLETSTGEHHSNEPGYCDHKWHQMVLILDGEMVNEDLDTGAIYRGHKGDFIYFGPGLWHTVRGEFRVLATKAPPPRRYVRTATGVSKLYMSRLQNETLFPGTPPDYIQKKPIAL